MVGRALNRFWLGKVGLCMILVLLSACSMQKSGSKVDASRADNSCKPPDGRPKQNISQGQDPLKVDYLTPTCTIKRPEIYVYKEKRRLYVVQSNVLVRDYPIGLGFSPQGDKLKQGDGRTPEGNFFICMKNPASRFVKSLGLSYPDKKHAEQALFAGIITPLEFKDILLAFEKSSAPPWRTALGGEIFIHAGGAHKDWTDGCIALYNSDMEELYSITSVGTPVSIRP